MANEEIFEEWEAYALDDEKVAELILPPPHGFLHRDPLTLAMFQSFLSENARRGSKPQNA